MIQKRIIFYFSWLFAFASVKRLSRRRINWDGYYSTDFFFAQSLHSWREMHGLYKDGETLLNHESLLPYTLGEIEELRLPKEDEQIIFDRCLGDMCSFVCRLGIKDAASFYLNFLDEAKACDGRAMLPCLQGKDELGNMMDVLEVSAIGYAGIYSGGVDDKLNFIQKNLCGDYVNDWVLGKWAEQLASAVFENENIEDAASVAIERLVDMMYNARLRIANNNKAIHNEIVLARALSMYTTYVSQLDLEFHLDGEVIRKMKILGIYPNEPQQDADVEAKECQDTNTGNRQWTDSLRQYFNRPDERIAMLAGRSDDDIIHVLKEWKKERNEESGIPIFKQNPYNNKSKFAKAMKENGLIENTPNTFRQSL